MSIKHEMVLVQSSINSRMNLLDFGRPHGLPRRCKRVLNQDGTANMVFHDIGSNFSVHPVNVNVSAPGERASGQRNRAPKARGELNGLAKASVARLASFSSGGTPNSAGKLEISKGVTTLIAIRSLTRDCVRQLCASVGLIWLQCFT